MNNSVLIAENIRLSYKLFANSIYISNNGDITIVGTSIPRGASIPTLTPEWLDTACRQFSYSIYGSSYSITDRLAQEGLITFSETKRIYDNIRNNTLNKNITLISL